MYNGSMKTKIQTILLGVLALVFVILTTKQVVEWKGVVDKANKCTILSKQLQYYREAERINDYYSRSETTTRIVVIRETLEAIDQYLPKYFPDGTYNRNDLIAMAMVESSFNQYLVGTHKEFGIFQIMPESCKWAGVKRNQFDIKVNTEMALFILKAKYDERKDYRKAIIAYNGFVVKDGRLSETYWKKFIKARKVVDDILSDSYLPTH